MAAVTSILWFSGCSWRDADSRAFLAHMKWFEWCASGGVLLIAIGMPYMQKAKNILNVNIALGMLIAGWVIVILSLAFKLHQMTLL